MRYPAIATPLGYLARPINADGQAAGFCVDHLVLAAFARRAEHSDRRQANERVLSLLNGDSSDQILERLAIVAPALALAQGIDEMPKERIARLFNVFESILEKALLC